MLTFTLGTFAIALNHLLLISALALATFVGWRVAKRGGENPESVLFVLFLLGLLAARIGFVVAYWQHYRTTRGRSSTCATVASWPGRASWRC